MCIYFFSLIIWQSYSGNYDGNLENYHSVSVPSKVPPSWFGFWDRKINLVEKQRNSNKVWSLFHSGIATLLFLIRQSTMAIQDVNTRGNWERTIWEFFINLQVSQNKCLFKKSYCIRYASFMHSFSRDLLSGYWCLAQSGRWKTQNKQYDSKYRNQGSHSHGA